MLVNVREVKKVASSTNPDKGRAGKRNKIMRAIREIGRTAKIMLDAWPRSLHGGVQSYQEIL